MLYGTTRAYIGSASQIADDIITEVKLVGGILYSKVRAYRSATAQAIAAITWMKVELNGVTLDLSGQFDSTVNYRFTIAGGLAGYYHIAANVSVYGDADVGIAGAAIYLNGVPMAIGRQNYPVGAPGAAIHVEDYLFIGELDYVEIWIWMETAGQVVSGAMYTWADFFRII